MGSKTDHHGRTWPWRGCGAAQATVTMASSRRSSSRPACFCLRRCLADGSVAPRRVVARPKTTTLIHSAEPLIRTEQAEVWASTGSMRELQGERQSERYGIKCGRSSSCRRHRLELCISACRDSAVTGACLCLRAHTAGLPIGQALELSQQLAVTASAQFVITFSANVITFASGGPLKVIKSFQSYHYRQPCHTARPQHFLIPHL
jgi:hypothetical protein